MLKLFNFGPKDYFENIRSLFSRDKMTLYILLSMYLKNMSFVNIFAG